jgi:hypothetical protein
VFPISPAYPLCIILSLLLSIGPRPDRTHEEKCEEWWAKTN